MSIFQKINLLFVATVLAATGVGAQSHSSSRLSASDAKEIFNYTLTMNKVQKTSTATNALNQLAKSHPELNNVSQSKTIDGILQSLQRYPDAVAIINRSGLSPREYVDCLMTVMQSGIAVSFKKSGTFKEYPPELLRTVSKANLDFTEQHWDQIQKLTGTGDDDQ